MTKRYDRRDVLKAVAATGASFLLPSPSSKPSPLSQSGAAVAENDVEIQVGVVSEHTLRFSVLPIRNGRVAEIPLNGSLHRTSWEEPILKLRGEPPSPIVKSIKSGSLRANVTTAPLALTVTTEGGEVLQRLEVNRETGVVSFISGNAPLLGLGEGGPQFDRRGSVDAMRSGQGGYQLATHGGRVPIPWLIGTAGWAIYIHHPFGTFDFWTGERLEGGREISRNVDLETMPLYVRAGSILPLGPVKQYSHERVDQPLSISIYPGGNASFLVYEDDGISFNYRKGEWMGLLLDWNDARRSLTMNLAPGSRMLSPRLRRIEVRCNQTTKPLVFDGNPVDVFFK